MRILFFAAVIAATSCHLVEEDVVHSRAGAADQGALVSIGGIPGDLSLFASSDCDKHGFADCSAEDNGGRKYGFFNGGLSRLSLSRSEAAPGAELPAGMHFGEDIEAARQKASEYYCVEFDRGEIDGRVVYSSDFKIRSERGTLYSLELVGDGENKLEEVVERTDF